MTTFIQQLVNALSLGGTYALLALGVALVFNIMTLINFAHAELMTASGYALFFGLQVLPFAAAVAVALLVGVVVAVLMERIAFRPLRNASGETLMLASFAISILLQIVFQNAISARGKAVDFPTWLEGTISVGSVDVGVIQVVSIVTTIVMLGLLTVMLRRSTIGLAMRAAAFDFPTTRLMGVRANRVFAAAFAVSGLLAAVAGVLWVGQRGTVDPLMGSAPVLTAFIAAILGGLGTLSGPVLGGFLLGALNVMVQAYVPQSLQQYQAAIVITLVVAIMAFRPAGLIDPDRSGPTPLDRFRAARARSGGAVAAGTTER